MIATRLPHKFAGVFTVWFQCPHCGENSIEIDAANTDIEPCRGGIQFWCSCAKSDALIFLSLRFLVQTEEMEIYGQAETDRLQTQVSV